MILIFKYTKKLLFPALLFMISGCATTYYPLRNESYFKKQENRTLSVVLLPFEPQVFTYINQINTMEKLKQKTKDADEYLYRAFKEEVELKNYKLVQYISLEETESEDFDQNILMLLSELNKEYNLSEISLRKNLNDDKGKLSDYSIGIRTEELGKLLNSHPDLFLIIEAGGYIAELDALNALNATASAIASLGLSLLMPTPEDIIFLNIALIDSKSGDIVWYDSTFYTGHSFLLYPHVKDSVKQVLSKLPDATGKINSSKKNK